MSEEASPAAALAAPLTAEVVRSRKKRLEFSQIVARATEKVGRTVTEMMVAVGPLPPDATPRQEKIWKDMNQPASKAPVWIRTVTQLGAQVLRAEVQKPARRLNLVFVLPGGKRMTKEEWKEAAARLEAKDREDRKQLEARYRSEEERTKEAAAPSSAKAPPATDGPRGG